MFYFAQFQVFSIFRCFDGSRISTKKKPIFIIAEYKRDPLWMNEAIIRLSLLCYSHMNVHMLFSLVVFGNTVIFITNLLLFMFSSSIQFLRFFL